MRIAPDTYRRAIRRTAELPFLCALALPSLRARLEEIARPWQRITIGGDPRWQKALFCAPDMALATSGGPGEDASSQHSAQQDDTQRELRLSLMEWNHACPDIPQLAHLHRQLPPGSAVLGLWWGPKTLASLKQAFARLDAEHTQSIISRFGAFPSMRQIGDSLTQAGFCDVVVDIDPLKVHYGDIRRLINDLRDAGLNKPQRIRPDLSGPNQPKQDLNAPRTRLYYPGRNAYAVLDAFLADKHPQKAGFVASFFLHFTLCWSAAPRAHHGMLPARPKKQG